MPAPKGARPITEALKIVESTEYDPKNGGYWLPSQLRFRLIRILKTGDASTGKPDSARKRHANKPAKKAAKAARARR